MVRQLPSATTQLRPENFTGAKSVPIMFGPKDESAYGLFFDNPYASRWFREKAPITASIHEALIWTTTLSVGKPSRTLSATTPVTSAPAARKNGTLGYQQSRWGYGATRKWSRNRWRFTNTTCRLMSFTWISTAAITAYLRGTTMLIKVNKNLQPTWKNQGTKIVWLLIRIVKKDQDTTFTVSTQTWLLQSKARRVAHRQSNLAGDSVFPDFGNYDDPRLVGK